MNENSIDCLEQVQTNSSYSNCTLCKKKGRQCHSYDQPLQNYARVQAILRAGDMVLRLHANFTPCTAGVKPYHGCEGHPVNIGHYSDESNMQTLSVYYIYIYAYTYLIYMCECDRDSIVLVYSTGNPRYNKYSFTSRAVRTTYYYIH